MTGTEVQLAVIDSMLTDYGKVAIFGFLQHLESCSFLSSIFLQSLLLSKLLISSPSSQLKVLCHPYGGFILPEKQD